MKTVPYGVSFVALVALAATACGCKGCRAPAASEGKAVTAAVERCRKAVAEITEPDAGRSDQWPNVYGQACAELYQEPGCRAAWLSENEEPPELRMRAVILACAAEYCSFVDEPRPALCGINRDTVEPKGLTSRWPELHAAILAHELGTSRHASVVDEINRVFQHFRSPHSRRDPTMSKHNS